MSNPSASTGFARITKLASRIPSMLNRVVFTGIETCEWVFDDDAAAVRGSSVRRRTVTALATVALDRIGVELATAGLTRVRRTADADEWGGPDGTRLTLGQSATEVLNAADALVREYATLLTHTVPVDDSITVRASAPPAQLALWWRARATSGDAAARDQILEDIIELVVRRGTIVQDVQMLPTELRQLIAMASTTFVGAANCDWAITRAMSDSRLSPGIVDRILSRFRQLATAASPTQSH